MDKKIKGYIEFGNEIEYKKREVINTIFIFFIFNFFAIVFMQINNGYSIVAICTMIVNLIVLIFLVYITSSKKVTKLNVYLFKGIESISLAITFLSIALVFLPSHLQIRVILIYLLISTSVILLINYWIKKGTYCNYKSNTSKVVVFTVIGMILGLLIAPILVSQLDNQSIICIAIGSGLLISEICMMLGIALLHKLFFIYKHKYTFN